MFEGKYTINSASGCWDWNRLKDKDGYGKVGYNYKTYRAHRLSYIINKGEIGNMCVLHTCDNPSCINPEHLFLGTQKDNMDDMRDKRRNYKAVGFLHGRCKLTKAQIVSIKNRLKDNQTCVSIAIDFNVNERTIGRIKSGDSWSSI